MRYKKLTIKAVDFNQTSYFNTRGRPAFYESMLPQIAVYKSSLCDLHQVSILTKNIHSSKKGSQSTRRADVGSVSII